ncbi:MAG: hypothetical protein R3B90_22075 [Planctomycetaceae bacterium]
MRRLQQAIDHLLEGVRRLVSKEGVEFGDGGGESRQVESDAAEQQFAIGFRAEGQPFRLEPTEDESIDRITDPVGRLDLGNLRGGRRRERPVTLKLRSLLEPAAEGRDIGGLEFLVRVGRGHHLFRVDRRDPLPAFTVVQTRCERVANAFLGVETQVGLAVPVVWAVTEEALRREDRPNVTVEEDGLIIGQNRLRQPER